LSERKITECNGTTSVIIFHYYLNKILIFMLYDFKNCNLIVIRRLRDERVEERGNSADVENKIRGGQSPRATSSSHGGHSPVLNLSKSGNDHESNGAPSERSNSPNPSIHEDDDNISDGNVSDVDEHNDKDDDG
jgi:hypothetical protein